MQFTQKQIEFIQDIESPVLAFIGGFGSGKTFSGSFKGLYLSGLNPGCAGMMVSPTFPMLRDTTRRTFFEILESENVSFDFRATDNKILLKDIKSEVWFRSADDPNKLKGSNLAWIGMDEPALMHRDAYLISLSRLRDPKAKIRQLFLTGTPEGFNWLYDELMLNPDGKRVVRASTEENTFITKDYVESLYKNYDEQLVKQYIKGEFVLLNKGQVYYSFNRELNHTDTEYNPNLPVIVTIDFNVNPMCWVLVQNYNDKDIAFSELIRRNANTEMMCRELMEKYPKAHFEIYGDYSGNQRHTSSAVTDYDIMKRMLPSAKYNLKPNPPVIDRINAVNARLCNSKGERKLLVNTKNCPHLTQDFEQVVYKEGKREIDKSYLERTHSSDALGYYIEWNYSLKGKPIIQHNFR